MATPKRRRAKGTGTIQKVGDTYYPRVTINGKMMNPLRRGYDTREEADEALDRWRASEMLAPMHPLAHVLTVGNVLEAWLDNHTGKPTTLANYREMVYGNLIPAFGQIPIGDLNSLHVSRFVGESHRKGLSARTVKNRVVTLRTALESAVRADLIHRNPAKGVPLPKPDDREVDPWSDVEVTRFLIAATNHRLCCLFSLIVHTGVRKGEALGLAWSGLDLDAGTMTLRQTLVSPTGASPVLQTSTKTQRSKRMVPLPADLIAELRLWRSVQNAERLSYGSLWGSDFGATIERGADTDLVFTNSVGGVVKPDWVNRTMNRITEDAGLRHGSVHDLRHAWATAALLVGAPEVLVAGMVGHSMVSRITRDVYFHPNLEAMREAQNMVRERRRLAENGE